MGGILGRAWRGRDDPDVDDFEMILSQLDQKIHRTEVKIAEGNLQHRKLIALVTTYSVLVYSVWLASFFFLIWPSLGKHGEEGILEVLAKGMPIIAIPSFLTSRGSIYLFRRVLTAYHRRSSQILEQELQSYRKKQKQKVEEMKQKMKYYAAKTLIERYDGDEGAVEDPANVKRSSAAPAGQLSPLGPSPSQHPPTSMPAENGSSISPHIQFTVQQPQQLHSLQSPYDLPQQTPWNNLNAPAFLEPASPSPFHHSPQVPFSQYSNTSVMLPHERTWVDRLLDIIIGEDAPVTKYALICEKCFNHNGLCPPEEYDQIQYTCPTCGHFNSKRKQRFPLPPQQVQPGDTSTHEKLPGDDLPTVVPSSRLVMTRKSLPADTPSPADRRSLPLKAEETPLKEQNTPNSEICGEENQDQKEMADAVRMDDLETSVTRVQERRAKRKSKK